MTSIQMTGNPQGGSSSSVVSAVSVASQYYTKLLHPQLRCFTSKGVFGIRNIPTLLHVFQGLTLHCILQFEAPIIAVEFINIEESGSRPQLVICALTIDGYFYALHRKFDCPNSSKAELIRRHSAASSSILSNESLLDFRKDFVELKKINSKWLIAYGKEANAILLEIDNPGNIHTNDDLVSGVLTLKSRSFDLVIEATPQRSGSFLASLLPAERHLQARALLFFTYENAPVSNDSVAKIPRHFVDALLKLRLHDTSVDSVDPMESFYTTLLLNFQDANVCLLYGSCDGELHISYTNYLKDASPNVAVVTFAIASLSSTQEIIHIGYIHCKKDQSRSNVRDRIPFGEVNFNSPMVCVISRMGTILVICMKEDGDIVMLNCSLEFSRKASQSSNELMILDVRIHEGNLYLLTRDELLFCNLQERALATLLDLQYQASNASSLSLILPTFPIRLPNQTRCLSFCNIHESQFTFVLSNGEISTVGINTEKISSNINNHSVERRAPSTRTPKALESSSPRDGQLTIPWQIQYYQHQNRGLLNTLRTIETEKSGLLQVSMKSDEILAVVNSFLTLVMTKRKTKASTLSENWFGFAVAYRAQSSQLMMPQSFAVTSAPHMHLLITITNSTSIMVQIPPEVVQLQTCVAVTNLVHNSSSLYSFTQSLPFANWTSNKTFSYSVSIPHDLNLDIISLDISVGFLLQPQIDHLEEIKAHPSPRYRQAARMFVQSKTVPSESEISAYVYIPLAYMRNDSVYLAMCTDKNVEKSKIIQMMLYMSASRKQQLEGSTSWFQSYITSLGNSTPTSSNPYNFNSSKNFHGQFNLHPPHLKPSPINGKTASLFDGYPIFSEAFLNLLNSLPSAVMTLPSTWDLSIQFSETFKSMYTEWNTLDDMVKTLAVGTSPTSILQQRESKSSFEAKEPADDSQLTMHLLSSDLKFMPSHNDSSSSLYSVLFSCNRFLLLPLTHLALLVRIQQFIQTSSNSSLETQPSERIIASFNHLYASSAPNGYVISSVLSALTSFQALIQHKIQIEDKSKHDAFVVECTAFAVRLYLFLRRFQSMDRTGVSDILHSFLIL